ncbi:MAG: TetR/AcrR family transcriptional regulator [Chitinophagaceae bacterium]|nr:TetR/AcrR family transcriptional regulator [Chitinophagaceae bacterium]
MSKNKIPTKELIVEKALEMYNAQGIEYVGVRELSRELNMKGGNITYYFPTKNDLVRELISRLSEGNSQLFAAEQEPGIYSFLQMNRKIYENQYRYRSLFVSLPLLLKQDPEYAERYQEIQVVRRKNIYNQLRSMFMGGYFQTGKTESLDTILDALAMNNRMWISEATLDGILDDKDTAINTYLFRQAGLLHIIASEKGKKDIVRFLRELDE